jgi:hypothetical protein
MFYHRAVYPFGLPPQGMDVLWRCQVRTYSVIVDAEREEYSTKSELEIIWFKVLKRTEKSIQIKDIGGARFLRINTTRKYACETREEAIQSFIEKKKRQIEILIGQLTVVKYNAAWATEELERVQAEQKAA